MKMDSCNEELETKTQELYTANRNIERLSSNVEHLENENEYLKTALAEETEKLEEAKKNEGKSKNDEMFRQMIAELRQDLEGSQALEKSLKEDNVRLEKRLEQIILESAAGNVSVGTADAEAEEFAELMAKISSLEEERVKLQAQLAEAAAQLQREAGEKTRLQQEMEEKDEEIECMESQFSTQCNISESLREEIQQLKAQLESETGQVDATKKGNSLFSEVDDRRVAAEKKCVHIQQQMRLLEEKLTRETKENKRLKNQLAFARQSSKKGYDEEAVKRLQEQVVESKKTARDLTEKLSKLESTQKPTVTETWAPSSNTTDDDKRYIGFLEALIRTKTKEIKEIQSQAQDSRLQSVRTELHLTQANNEVMTLRHNVDQLKLRNSHLTFTLNELRHKHEEGSGADSKSPKQDRQPGSNNKTTVTTTATAAAAALSPLRNISNLGDNNRASNLHSDHTEGSMKKAVGVAKKGVRLRDLVDLPDPCPKGVKGSKGVQMVSEVTLMNTDGERSTAELRHDGNSGKPRRLKGGSATSKFKSVSYGEAADTKPSECNQQ